MRHSHTAAEPELRRIAFATIGDARKVGFWSGTPFHMAKSLAATGHEVVYAGPLNAPILPLYKAYSRVRRAFGGQRVSPFHASPVVAQFAADAVRNVAAISPDVVFAPAGSSFASAIPVGTPLVYASDATFRLVENYHPNYRGMLPGARATAEQLERKTIARANLLLYPSDWAAESAIRDYSADPARVHVISWGANLSNPPSRASALGPRKEGPCRLLFIGADWREKGADMAVATLTELTNMGVDAELVICGCTPPAPVARKGLQIIPYLDKNDPEQLNRIGQLYRDADIFLLPTQADCYGIVFCEAAAYGVPSVAPRTGGVPSAVSAGETGLLLPPTATSKDYATAIAQIFADPVRLERLKQASRDAYEKRLNWGIWSKRVSELIQGL